MFHLLLTLCLSGQVQPKDLNNGVINACFLLLFKDLIKLYACYNDGIINLLGTSISLTSVNRITPVERHMLSLPPLSEKFFQMKRSQCKDGLEIYKRFLTRMTRVSDFFKIAEVERGPRPHAAAVPARPAEFQRLSLFSFTANGDRQK